MPASMPGDVRNVLQVDPVGVLPPHLENAIDYLGILVQQQNGGHLGERFIPWLWLDWGGGLAGLLMCSGPEIPLRHS